MSKLTAVVLESTVVEGCPQPEIDELRANSDEIAGVLDSLGYKSRIIPFSLDVADVRAQLLAVAPSVVINLVDSIEGKGDLIAMSPMLLAHMEIPFTGASATTTTTTCNKLLTKQILRAHNLPTADWLSEDQIEQGGAELSVPYILKSVTEHASFGIFANSIVPDSITLLARYREKKREYGGQWFAEAYIDGREFNQSALVIDGEIRTLPPAEIVFTPDFPKDKPRIIDYSAKWLKDTQEYKGTVRSFDFDGKAGPLPAKLRQCALDCWQAFGLTGYARIDFRVTPEGEPYIVDVNSNPLLTAHEGFGVAAAQAGMPFAATVRAVIEDAYRRALRPLPEMLAA